MDSKEKSVKKVIKSELCLSCGACLYACNRDAIKVGDDNIPYIIKEKCVKCGLCKKACVGIEDDFFDYYENFHEKPFDKENLLGDFKECFLSYASQENERENGTSGGFIRAFLQSLFDEGKIVGAFLVSSDSREIWKAKGTFVKSKEEFLNLDKSHYERSCLFSSLKDIETIEGKIAVVALPCQLHALQKLRNLFPKLNERILVTIGLFCHAQIEVEPQRYVFNKLGIDISNIKKYISRYGKHPGTPCVRLQDDTLKPVYFSSLQNFLSKFISKEKIFIPSSHEILNLFYKFFIPRRCKFCFDGASLLSDISVGDPWIRGLKNIDFKKGYSFVVVRSRVGKELVDLVSGAKKIVKENLANEDIKKCNQKMLKNKFKSAMYFIKKEKKVFYKGIENLKINFSFKDKICLFISRKTFYLFKKKIIRKIFLRCLFSLPCYALIYINHLRRKFLKK